MQKALITLFAVGITSAAALTLAPADAAACGGFFCNNTPVSQTGENILFAVDGDEIEAHILVNYQGAAEDFAWIVPTPAFPEVGVSTGSLFTRLDQMVSPRFQLRWEYIGDCNNSRGDVLAGAADDDGLENAPPSDPGVEVLQQSSIGPYDFAILQATDTAELFDWLEANDYDIPDTAAPMVQPYVLMGNDIHFVAFRLSKNSDVGDLQPIRLRYAGDEPMVPIQLTAVASEPDMGVLVHVLGDARAVPDNYLHVHINEARIDWLNNAWNYDEVVTEAMNEAGGQGFTTEFAGASSVMEGTLFTEGTMDTSVLASIGDPIEFFEAMQRQGFAADPQLMNLLQTWIPMSDGLEESGVTPRDFYNCLECYATFVDVDGFDSEGFANALELTIVGPLRHAQELFDRLPYLSRLYTTLSAEEMTLDPAFVFNSEMGDVSNVHEATAIVRCDASPVQRDTTTVRLDDGRSMLIDTSNGSAAGWEAFDNLPAAESIEETGRTGSPVLVLDNSRLIEVEIAISNDAVREDLQRFRGDGCSVSAGSVASSSPRASWAGLASLAAFGMLRRRRRR